MSMPVKTLPVVQNWDCHVTGTCCKEYRVTLSADEVERIQAQGWTPEDLGGHEPFRKAGYFSKDLQLNHREDGSCVFLGEQGRCRIHEKHGYETKPLPCRLFPFVLVPAGDGWRVGLRYACPSAASNKGRALPEHAADLRTFADGLAAREKLTPRPDGTLTPPPWLDNGVRLDWPDTLAVVDALVGVLRNRRDTFERRARKALHVVENLRRAVLRDIQGKRLVELIDIFTRAADAEVPKTPAEVPAPGWVGRILFRQAAALFLRKDHGPNRGIASRGRVALLSAALRFARGRGPVPRLHAAVPEATFEALEVHQGPPPAEVDAVLERYYAIKVGSMQFCGAPSFGMSLYEGFEALMVTLPIILWTSRLFRDRPRDQAVMAALTIIDDHVGFNRVLGGMRQRLAFRILARTGQLPRLAAWYAR